MSDPSIKVRAGNRLIPLSITQEDGRLYLAFPYNKDFIVEVKSMEKPKWHGFDDPPRKIWSVADSERNWFTLRYLSGHNPYKQWDLPPVMIESHRPLLVNQKRFVGLALARKRMVFAHEMGCIAGDTLISTSTGKARADKLDQPFYAMIDGKAWRASGFWSTGVKHVIQVKFEDGSQLTCTPDHRIRAVHTVADSFGWIAAGDLIPGSSLVAVDGHKYTTVDSIIDTGHEMEVYDCSVPGLNAFVANGIVIHNSGKSLASIETIERINALYPDTECWFIGPKSAVKSVQLEMLKWKATTIPRTMTYEAFTRVMKNAESLRPPRVVIFDESSKLKNHSSQRTQAALLLTEQMRETWNNDCYIIVMSGSPAPKSPADWWAQVEVAQPGYLKEGNIFLFKGRLSLSEQRESISGGMYPHHLAWLDDSARCAKCGIKQDEHPSYDAFSQATDPKAHAWQASINEVAYLYERMKGIVDVVWKKDCMDLPEKVYHIVQCTPTVEQLQAALIIKSTVGMAAKQVTMLRELSDGFQYQEVPDGTEVTCPRCYGQKEVDDPVLEGETYKVVRHACPHCEGSGVVPRLTRTANWVGTPKDDELINLLDQHEEYGRIVIFAAFEASIDHIVELCQREGWTTLRIDGRGYHGSKEGMSCSSDELLKAMDNTHPDRAKWYEKYERVAVIGHPKAAGMGLTLTSSPSIIYYSNPYDGEARIQSEDRIHRPGCRGAAIYDIFNLKIDALVLNNLKLKRELQAITLGEIEV
jgi:hypothetical protein